MKVDRKRRRRVRGQDAPPVSREEFEALVDQVTMIQQRALYGREIVPLSGGGAAGDDGYAIRSRLLTQSTLVQSDGEAPGSSPAPTVRGALGALVVEYDPISNADVVTYNVHLSDVSGFTPDSSTLVAKKRGGGPVYLRTLAGGSPLEYWDDPPTNSVPKVYYVQIVAEDEDGEAAASVEASGSMDQTAGLDILAGSITAELLAATLVISSIFKTASSGQRVEFDVDGIRLYDSDGTTLLADFPTTGSNPYVRAALDALGLNIEAEVDVANVWNPDADKRVAWVNSAGDEIARITAVQDPAEAGKVRFAPGILAPEGAPEAIIQVSARSLDGLDGTGDAGIFVVWEPPGGGPLGAVPFVRATASVDGGSTEFADVINGDGESSFVQILGGPDLWRVEYTTVSINLPNTNSLAGGSGTVALPGVAVGDLVVLLGWDQANFVVHVENIVTVADQLNYQYRNIGAAASDPAASTYHLLVIHRS